MYNKYFQLVFIDNKLVVFSELVQKNQNEKLSLELTVLKMQGEDDNLIETGLYLEGVIAIFLDANHQKKEINIPKEVYELSVKIWDDIHRTYDYVTLQENRIIKYQQTKLVESKI